MSEPSGPGGQSEDGQSEDGLGEEQTDEQSERRRRVMERLAEMLQGPPPDRSGAGPVAGGGVEQAIAGLGLGLSAEDTEVVAGALSEGPDPEEAAALFRALLEGFQAWQRKPRPDGGSDESS